MSLFRLLSLFCTSTNLPNEPLKVKPFVEQYWISAIAEDGPFFGGLKHIAKTVKQLYYEA